MIKTFYLYPMDHHEPDLREYDKKLQLAIDSYFQMRYNFDQNIRCIQARKEGYKDETCSKCKAFFRSHKHFIRCSETDCPMKEAGGKSLAHQILDHHEVVTKAEKTGNG